jgi:1,4-alpha-glucan branching enzyme
VRHGYRIGIPEAYGYREVFNSDDKCFGGTGISEKNLIIPENVSFHGYEKSVSLTLPPLSAVFFKPVFEREETKQY